ncbi:MAG: hypothetical protein ACTSPM_11900 [Candidatus Heimdallarchaeota archaeon]
MTSTKETQKSIRKKSFFLITIFFLFILILFTSSLNSSFEMNGHVQNELDIIPRNSLFDGSDSLTINKVRGPREPMILIEDVGKFLTYFFISAVLLIVPIFGIVYYVIYPSFKKKKAMKDLENSNLQDDADKKSGHFTDFRIYEKRIVYNIISIGLVLFFVQNALALIILTLSGAIGSWTTNTDWYYYLWNIPLVLDLVVGLIFTIGFLVAFCSTKNKKTIVTSIFWILWMAFSIVYRVLLGMPSYKYLIDTDVTASVIRMYLAGIFFAVSQVLFWFAIFMTDLSLRLPNQSIFSRITLFGTMNYLIGIPSALLIPVLSMDMSTDAAFLLAFALFIPTFIAKVIIPPIIGMVTIFSLYRAIKKDYTTDRISTNF